MPTRLTTGEVSDRCLGVISRCVGEGNSLRANLMMRDEIQEIAREVSRWKLGGESKARHLLRPMEEALVGRYGTQVGRRLYWDFVEAFWIASFSDSAVDHSERDQPMARVPEFQMQNEGRIRPIDGAGSRQDRLGPV